MAASRMPLDPYRGRVASSWLRRVPLDGPVLLLGAAVIALPAAVVFLLLVRDEAADRALVDLMPVALDLIAAWLILRAARRAVTRRAEVAWATIAVAMVVYLIGDGLFAGFDLALGSVPFPSLADVAYTAFYPLMLVALLSFPGTPGARGERRRLVIDTAIIVIGAAMVVWQSLLQPALQSVGADPIATALALGYPGGDLVLVFGIAAIALRRPAGVQPRALVALVGGVIAPAGVRVNQHET